MFLRYWDDFELMLMYFVNYTVFGMVTNYAHFRGGNFSLESWWCKKQFDFASLVCNRWVCEYVCATVVMLICVCNSGYVDMCVQQWLYGYLFATMGMRICVCNSCGRHMCVQQWLCAYVCATVVMRIWVCNSCGMDMCVQQWLCGASCLPV